MSSFWIPNFEVRGRFHPLSCRPSRLPRRETALRGESPLRYSAIRTPRNCTRASCQRCHPRWFGRWVHWDFAAFPVVCIRAIRSPRQIAGARRERDPWISLGCWPSPGWPTDWRYSGSRCRKSARIGSEVHSVAPAIPVVYVHVATVLAISYLRGSSLSLLLPHVIGLCGHLVAPAAFLDGLVCLDLDAALPAVASHHDFGALGPEDGDQNGTHNHHSDKQKFFLLGRRCGEPWWLRVMIL